MTWSCPNPKCIRGNFLSERGLSVHLSQKSECQRASLCKPAACTKTKTSHAPSSSSFSGDTKSTGDDDCSTSSDKKEWDHISTSSPLLVGCSYANDDDSFNIGDNEAYENGNPSTTSNTPEEEAAEPQAWRDEAKAYQVEVTLCRAEAVLGELSEEHAVALARKRWALSAGVNPSLFEIELNHISEGNSKLALTESDKIDIQILSLMRKHNIPLNAFNELSDLVTAGRSVGHYRHRPRETVLKRLKKHCNLQDIDPIEKVVKLPHSDLEIKVTTHNFLAAFASLLQDEFIMQDEHLLFHEAEDGSPFGTPPEQADVNIMQDVNDGSVFRDAYRVHVKHPRRDLLVPIIFFIDKTYVDTYGRLTIEPVSFTLGIFKKEFRRLPQFWRCLGYISEHGKKLESSLKADEYHIILRTILESFTEAQKLKGGIGWILKYNGKEHPVAMKIPILFVCGDTEGHDKMCGKYLSRGEKIKRLCRYCDCPTENMDGTVSIKDAKYKHTRASDTAKLVKDGKREELKGISYHCITNAFTENTFMDPERGINGAAPAELLHVMQHGLHLYFLEALFGAKRKNKKAKSKSKETKVAGKTATQCDSHEDSDSNTSSDSDSDGNGDGDRSTKTGSDSDGDGDGDAVATTSATNHVSDFTQASTEELSRNRIFSDTVKNRVDELSMKYGRILQKQSDREYDRAAFSCGITQNAKKRGHEESSVLILLLIIFCSSEGSDFQKLFGSDSRMGLYVAVDSFLLLLEDFFKSSSVLKRDIGRIEKCMPEFMRRFKLAAARETGMGMKLIKFHLLLHLHEDIQRFGPPCSYDSSYGESMHKDFKANAHTTQKRRVSFDRQLAQRYTEILAVDQSRRRLNPPRAKPVLFPDVEPVVASPFEVTTSFRKFVVKNDGMFLCRNGQTAAPPTAQWPNGTLMDQVTEYIQEIILPHIEASEVYLTTRATVNGCLYTADPTEIIPEAHLPRHDWTYAFWKNSGAAPARIITFFEIKIAPQTAFVDPITEETYKGDGLYSIVQAFPQNDLHDQPNMPGQKYQLAHPASHLIYKSQLTSSPEGKINLYLIKVDPMFRGPLIAVPYDLSANEQLEWLIVEPRHRRNTIFRNQMKEMIESRKKEEETLRRNLEEQRKQTNKKNRKRRKRKRKDEAKRCPVEEKGETPVLHKKKKRK